jgi:hypothetical protein
MLGRELPPGAIRSPNEVGSIKIEHMVDSAAFRKASR